MSAHDLDISFAHWAQTTPGSFEMGVAQVVRSWLEVAGCTGTVILRWINENRKSSKLNREQEDELEVVSNGNGQITLGVLKKGTCYGVRLAIPEEYELREGCLLPLEMAMHLPDSPPDEEVEDSPSGEFVALADDLEEEAEEDEPSEEFEELPASTTSQDAGELVQQLVELATETDIDVMFGDLESSSYRSYHYQALISVTEFLAGCPGGRYEIFRVNNRIQSKVVSLDEPVAVVSQRVRLGFVRLQVLLEGGYSEFRLRLPQGQHEQDVVLKKLFGNRRDKPKAKRNRSSRKSSSYLDVGSLAEVLIGKARDPKRYHHRRPSLNEELRTIKYPKCSAEAPPYSNGWLKPLPDIDVWFEVQPLPDLDPPRWNQSVIFNDMDTGNALFLTWDAARPKIQRRDIDLRLYTEPQRSVEEDLTIDLICRLRQVNFSGDFSLWLTGVSDFVQEEQKRFALQGISRNWILARLPTRTDHCPWLWIDAKTADSAQVVVKVLKGSTE